MANTDLAVYWIDEAPQIEIRSGIVCCSVASGKAIFEIRATPAILLESIRRSTAVYDDFIEQNGKRVPRIRRRDKAG